MLDPHKLKLSFTFKFTFDPPKRNTQATLKGYHIVYILCCFSFALGSLALEHPPTNMMSFPYHDRQHNRNVSFTIYKKKKKYEHFNKKIKR